ncbi:hypothetical protein MUK51_07120 [Sphingobacterium faecium]|uniref:hypothetical protein n=1 Tax=Sphingobacterium faecium TaxID=34087 RepID=UPI0021B61F32|nr:hypothetical protein [Sphingobacterium faecium]UXD71056.1 hypothetical protein MUK51_07120 [Sphingobacterium faecium]
MKIPAINIRYLLTLFIGAIVFQSCTKTTPEETKVIPEPEPEKGPDPIKDLTYIYSTESQVEFGLYQNNELLSSFVSADQEKKFKNRPKYFRPQAMTLKKDSLFISKAGGYKESYKIKWEKEDLFIYQDQDKDWKHFATKNDKNEISLNIALYNSQLKSENSNALRSGQLYNPSSINDILSVKSRAAMKTIWLKIKVIYVPENIKS